jgi:hypothetical protein
VGKGGITFTRFRFLRSTLAAALVGTLCGAALAVWSARYWPPRLAAAAAEPAPDDQAAAKKPAAWPDSVDRDGLERQPESGGVIDARALAEAPALALRGDVRGLLALRERVAPDADADEGPASEPQKQQLAELDRYLRDARARRLALDARDLKRSSAAATP